MHQNLVQMQQNAVDTVRDILDILEVENKKPLIMVAMMMAEKPLTEDELAKRTGLDDAEMKKGIEKLRSKNILTVFNEEEDPPRFEINPEIEKVMIRRIRSKMEKILDTMQNHIETSKELLESGKPDFDNYDLLMAKFLRARMHKAWMIHHILGKKRVLLNFLETGEVDREEIKKISID